MRKCKYLYETIQYGYFYSPDPVLAVFAFKGIDYYNLPLVRAAEKERKIASLRFFPKIFNGLIEKTLSFEDAHIVEFKGEKVRASQDAGEKRPGEKKRKTTYEALDGDFALAEMKYNVTLFQSG